MAKKLNSVTKTKGGFVVSSLKISDLDPNIITGYIHINEAGGRKLGRWRYERKANLGEHTNTYKEGEVEGSFDLDLKGIKVNDESDLFTFRINSWHANLFYWLYKVRPHETFKGMCPYFWLYVLTFFFCWLIIPIIILHKIISFIVPTLGNKIDNFARYMKNRKEMKFLEKWNEKYETLTPTQALALSDTKCYRKWGYRLNYPAYNLIGTLANKEFSAQYEKERQAKSIKEEKLRKIKFKTTEYKETIKDSIITKILGYILLSFVIYVLGAALYSIAWIVPATFNFLIDSAPAIGEGIVDLFKILLLFILPVAVVIYLLVIFVKAIYCWVSCNIKIRINLKTPKFLTRIGYSLEIAGKYIAKFFNILGVTIVAIYENNCPRLTWKK